jgi:hypothetical protein
VIVAEISRGVIAASPLFDHGNLGVSRNPKIQVKRGDAYRTLLRSQGTYDVIVSEPSNPWVTGVEMLYSREFLEAARASLAPGGVYGQWFHIYETDIEVVKLVLRTYTSVFPNVSVWFTMHNDLLLLGFDRPDRALDVDALESRFRQPDFAAAFARVRIESFPQLLAHELLPLGTLHAVKLEGPIHTLRHPILSQLAARAFFPGQRASLPLYLSDDHQRVSRRNALLGRYMKGEDRYSEESLEAAARETCRYNHLKDCLTFFARWANDHPQSPRMQTVIGEVRASLGDRRGAIAPNKIIDMKVLFEGNVNTTKLGFKKVRSLTNLYTTHYNHAVPFDEDVLEAIWNRCHGQRCARARRTVERIWHQQGAPSALPAMDQEDAGRYMASPPEPNRSTLGSSAKSESN